jgi:ABC-type nitrate/sulfonate/bicarbonate transport system permease component
MNDRPVAARVLAVIDQPAVLGWFAVAVVLVAWEVSVWIAGLNPIYLPRPTRIVIALVDMFHTGGLTLDLLATLGRIFGGFAIALVLGVALGVWMAT